MRTNRFFLNVKGFGGGRIFGRSDSVTVYFTLRKKVEFQ